MIRVQHEDFDHGAEYNALRQSAKSDGAIVTFTGLVRDFNSDSSVSSLEIEHYSGMTEKTLSTICNDAQKRWDLGSVSVIHRIGTIHAFEQIVFVGVTSTHRKDAFEAAQFIMDILKTTAPFWKQEVTKQGATWVKSKVSDTAAKKKW